MSSGDAIAPSPGLRLEVLEHLPTAVVVTRAADGLVIDLNPAAERLFGFAAAELVGRHVSVLNAPTDVSPQERAHQIISALEATGVWRGEVRNLRADGTAIWTEAEVTRFEDENVGSVWVSVHIDIAARRADEARRDERSARWRSAFELGPLGMAIVAPDLRIADVNDRLASLSGRSVEELLGTTLAALWAPEDVAVDAELAAAVRRGERPKYRVDKRLRRPDGELVPVTLTVSVVRGAGGEVLHELVVVDEARGDERRRFTRTA